MERGKCNGLFGFTIASLLIGVGGLDYGDALGKSLLFLEAQRSGRLPPTQRVTWRDHSGLKDGFFQGVDLVGGYYDAGDHVKFGLPMAFTVTMLSWSVVEYEQQIADADQLGFALEAIKWGTDYFIKAHPEPNVLWGEVGDGDTDHYCWQRAEDMTTPREAYKIDAAHPGSDLAAETAAAMAAASIAFRNSNASYSNILLQHAKQLFAFADEYRGRYDASIPTVKKYYCSASGYRDELLWAASWLFQATGDEDYLKYIADNAESLGGSQWSMTEFSWDVKYAGVQVLAAKVLMQGKGGQYASILSKYQSKAEFFLCACLQKNDGYNVYRTPGGLLYVRAWDNMQYVSTASFLLAVYSDYLSAAKGELLKCPSEQVEPSVLLKFAQSQADYILGQNPRATSYMVGFGRNFPRRVHHRGASIVSYKESPALVGCLQGYDDWYNRQQTNPNIVVGALVGGPDMNDNFEDDRHNYEQTEACTYNNAPLVGLFAKLRGVSENAVVNMDIASNPLYKNHSHDRPSVSVPSESHSASGFTSCPIALSHTISKSWSSRGRMYYRHRVTVTNISQRSVTQLTLTITNLGGPLWGLSQLRDKGFYALPSWLKALSPGQHFHFVYIQPGPQAHISVVNYN